MSLYDDCLEKALYLIDRGFINKDQLHETIEKLMLLEENKLETQSDREGISYESY